MFFRRLNWNIVGWFRIVSTISYLIIALGLGAMIYHGFQGGGGFHANRMLRLGLSFTGGTEASVTFTRPVTIPEVAKAIAPLHLAGAEITTVGNKGNEVLINTQTALANNSAPLWKALGTVAPVDQNARQLTSVGPSLGAEYLRDALAALVIALSIQFLYIAFRFGWNYIFGLVTVIALARDAAMMIGIYALANRQADDAFLAAVLTVIGYSVMDTIVILDRIRENTKLMHDRAYSYIVNESIKQTMTRSFNTLATVVITLVALLALGGATLKNFAFALLVGICSGGYHSIFFSAPLVLTFRKQQMERAAKMRAAARVPERASRSEESSRDRRGGVAREDIVAARHARRAREKAARAAAGAQSQRTRYRRKGGENTGTSTTAVAEEYDPLDAQNLGLHDEALEQGHEEINLNLDEFETETPNDAESDQETR
jgi:preprotein translocase SecF subunit